MTTHLMNKKQEKGDKQIRIGQTVLEATSGNPLPADTHAGQILNPCRSAGKSCSDWAEIFSTGSFNYLNSFYFIHLFFVSHC